MCPVENVHLYVCLRRRRTLFFIFDLSVTVILCLTQQWPWSWIESGLHWLPWSPREELLQRSSSKGHWLHTPFVPVHLTSMKPIFRSVFASAVSVHLVSSLLSVSRDTNGRWNSIFGQLWFTNSDARSQLWVNRLFSFSLRSASSCTPTPHPHRKDDPKKKTFWWTHPSGAVIFDLKQRLCMLKLLSLLLSL